MRGIAPEAAGAHLRSPSDPVALCAQKGASAVVQSLLVEHEAPKLILARLAQLEEEIATGRKELEEMLG